MKLVTTYRGWISGIMVAALLTGACNKIPLVPSEKNPVPPFSDNSKILMIVVDGVAGKQLERVNTPEINALKPGSI